jgi:hypothetical protein
MSKQPIKRMDIAEFRRDGYLQELNRRFLHPLSLALEVVIDPDGSERLGGIWDYRGDSEGIYYGEIEWEKYDRVERAWREREPSRAEFLGSMVQSPELKLGRLDE